MRNYLQRVLSSGARTTSPAKLPASARPLIPPIAPSGFPPGERNFPAFEGGDLETLVERAGTTGEFHTGSAERHRPSRGPARSRNEETQQQPPAPASVDATDSDSARADLSPESVSRTSEPETSTEGAAPSAATVIRAPKGLRNPDMGYEHRDAMARAIEQTLSLLAPRANKAPTDSATAIPNEQEVVSPPSPIRVQRKPAAASLAPVISPAAPTTFAESTVGQAEVQPIQATQRPSVSTPQAELRTPGRITEPLDPQQAMEVEPIPAQPLLNREKGEPQFFELRAKPPQAPSRPALPASPDNRRRQISIGRIDVQVNNVPAPAEPAARPARTPAQSNFMEGRYLNRFALKP